MSKKNKKKTALSPIPLSPSTATSVSPSPPPSEPSPLPAQPPPSASSSSPAEISRDILQDWDTFCSFQNACNSILADKQNIQTQHLAQFFKYAFDLGRSKSNEKSRELAEEVESIVRREREEAWDEGVREGKKAERSKWVSDGHVAGKECRAGRGQRVSIGVETTPKPHPGSPASTTTVSTSAQTEPVRVDTSVSLNWADEMSTIPIEPLIAVSCPNSPSRDLSALRSSEVAKPFASLQRRRILTTSPRSDSHSIPIQAMKYPFSKLPSRMSKSYRSSSGSSGSFPGSHSSKPSKPYCQHDWTNSLFALSDLARALGEMGWKPPNVFRSYF
jgi:hypothetical protein